MVGVLFDTNIYGKFVEEKDNREIVDKIESAKNQGKIVILNFKVIRDELRDAKAKKLLHLYDRLTSNNLHFPDRQVEKIADLYFKRYKEKGGIQKKNQNFMNDLRIIAFASIKGLNIVCSEDRKAFHSKLAQETYREINLKFLYRTPDFYTIDDLKKAWL